MNESGSCILLLLPLTHGVNLDKASPPASPGMFTWHRADEQAPVWKLELGLAGDGQGWVVVPGGPGLEGPCALPSHLPALLSTPSACRSTLPEGQPPRQP